MIFCTCRLCLCRSLTLNSFHCQRPFRWPPPFCMIEGRCPSLTVRFRTEGGSYPFRQTIPFQSEKKRRGKKKTIENQVFSVLIENDVQVAVSYYNAAILLLSNRRYCYWYNSRYHYVFMRYWMHVMMNLSYTKFGTPINDTVYLHII